ncbi:MAG: hypothetical protein HON53_09165 [Planctomycetaceae bacterium]|jgi:hypothetical protein|nr:hypothetical protein [Planctomycetaceae bacterium]MBT6153164.1 hypothetical protein [Planctomycetaceae bacterium]MBT6493429.1 hypothetical protein [Planctomycetaceae bacterium]
MNSENTNTRQSAFRALLFAYNIMVGLGLVLLGIGGLAGALYDNPALAFDVGMVHLLTGLSLLTAGVLLFAVRQGRRWKPEAIAHGVTVLGLLASSWSMWRVVEIAVTRRPAYMPIIAHGAVETFAAWGLIGCAALSLLATLILALCASPAESASPFK